MKLFFDPNFDKKVGQIFKVQKAGQSDFSGDITTASGLIFNEEETGEPGGAHADDGNPLSLSNISFNEPSSPINNSAEGKEEEKSM